MPSDAGLGSKEEDDAQLNERISKAHSELSKLHRKIIVGKSDRESNGPARRTRSRTLRPSPLDVDHGTSRERLKQQKQQQHKEQQPDLPVAKDAIRSDRMRLAELSDEQLKWPSVEKDAGTAPSAFLIPRAKRRPVDCIQMATFPRPPPTTTTTTDSTPIATTAKDLRGCSADGAQQALQCDDVTDDEALEGERRTRTTNGRVADTGDVRRSDELLDGKRGGNPKTHEELHTYVRQMEETIAQLVQQKDELVQNQVEFDKHASGIFPSLENLNQQLTQLVQGKLLHSRQSHTDNDQDPDHNDVATLHDDMLDELRVQREQLSELEADGKRRKYDAELQEQSRAIEISQIKADVISVIANGKMRDERAELMSDALQKVEQEMQEAVKSMVQRYQLLDKRVSQLQTAVHVPQVTEGSKTQWNTLRFLVTILLLGAIPAALGFLIVSSRDCGIMARCHPLI
uniref:Transmembrane protein n=1 Tax=Peronospora matthiolae TaxID=2874970 RepID=A0AAV1T9M5_9STRA